jgi:hypothetical protein
MTFWPPRTKNGIVQTQARNIIRPRTDIVNARLLIIFSRSSKPASKLFFFKITYVAGDTKHTITKHVSRYSMPFAFTRARKKRHGIEIMIQIVINARLNHAAFCSLLIVLILSNYEFLKLSFGRTFCFLCLPDRTESKL